MKSKQNLAYGAIAVAIVIGALILARAYTYKYRSQETVVVTGLGETEFVSDLIVWRGTLNVETQNVEAGYKQLERDKKIVSDFIKAQGIDSESTTYEFVNVVKLTESVYGSNGNYSGQRFKCYQLSQPITIESNDVEAVEAMSRSISELIAQGITVDAFSPSYYYTKLDDVKLSLIEKASADARQRAEKIGENSGAKLDGVKSARMGVFQITGANSNEEYMAGGSFNTMSRNKKARITMKIEYRIK